VHNVLVFYIGVLCFVTCMMFMDFAFVKVSR